MKWACDSYVRLQKWDPENQGHKDNKERKRKCPQNLRNTL